VCFIEAVDTDSDIILKHPMYGVLIFTSWRRDLPEKLTGPQIVRKFLTFYGTRRFIAAFTTVRHLSLA
jgi:hypothetical protein